MASMKMTFDVAYQDGRTVTTVAGPPDYVAFERQYNESVTKFNPEAMRLEWVYYLAWSSLHRRGLEPADFDTFLGQIDDATPVADEEAPDPTRPAASSSSSAD